MKTNKKIAVFAIFLLFLANTVQAFTQDYTPTDPNLVYQSYLNYINIGPSWSNELKTNKEVVVAILDSGVYLEHPDLKNNIWINPGEIPGDGIDNDNNSFIDDVHGWDFVSSDNDPEPTLDKDYDYTAINHGTVVAGIIAAGINNTGIVGIAPNAKIMPLRILDAKGVGNTLVLSQAIDYAVENGADIINLSLVGEFLGEPLNTSIINAYNKGVMIVAASGNEESVGISLDIDPRYPVCDIDDVNRVLGVAAVDENKQMTEFTNYGEQCIDISAPGTDFYSTTYYNSSDRNFYHNYQGGWSGTSVAAPIISATAALIKSQYPDLRPYDIYSIILASAQDLRESNPLHHIDLGAGLVDVGAALNLADHYYNDSIKIVVTPLKGLPPEVLIMDTEGNLESWFLAYNAGFRGGVNVLVSDVTGDGLENIVTAPMAGGGPHIRVFDIHGNVQSEFFAYDANFTGGVNIATGDVDGNGTLEIVTAPMAGGGPHIRVFDYQGNLLYEFFAYDAAFAGGVNVALGDVNNDEKDEIVTAPASNYIPEIKVFNYENRQKASFLAYDKDMTAGVNISIGDVNADHWPEIVTAPARLYPPQIKLFSMRGTLKSEFLSFSKYLFSGVKVLAKDISGDNLPEILVLPGRGSSALLRIYDSDGTEKSNVYLRNENDKTGYNFDILAR
ncbi:S8 family serine peptidase [Patescibacteria group bacterium]|nr:S8 family serine peptidase [Patescibacteria group bacterium]